MARTIEVAGISIFAKTAACAHACRYCLMGKKHVSRLNARRFVDVVDRFIEWRTANNPTFEIWQGVNYSANYSADDHALLLGLHDRLNWGRYSRRIHLGGLPFWSEAELEDWLGVRKDQGIESVHATLAGHGATHDYWNKRNGDFDYLLKFMSVAKRIGLGLRQRLLVVKSTIPLIEEAMALLDTAGEPLERYFTTFFYRGAALGHEHERITRADIDRLPASILQHSGWSPDDWRSESEWIGKFRQASGTSDRVMLQLELHDANIDEIDDLSCDALIERLSAQTAGAYRALPTRDELVDSWSDPNNALIYPNSADIERLWLDRYLAANPTNFERHLTHLSTTH